MAKMHIGNYDALTWVQDEIGHTLIDVLQAFEDTTDKPDSGVLTQCITKLHHVNGILAMLDLNGAAMLCQEILHTISSLKNEEKVDNSLHYCLTKALLLLPHYLKNISPSIKDHPLRLLPLINELKKSRHSPTLSAESLFQPSLAVTLPETIQPRPVQQQEINAMQKLVHAYQLSLVNWLKTNQEEHLVKLSKVITFLRSHSMQERSVILWWVVEGVCEALLEQGLCITNTIKLHLSQVSEAIKNFTYQDEQYLLATYPIALVNQLLLLIAQSTSNGPHVSQIKTVFELNYYDKTIHQSLHNLTDEALAQAKLAILEQVLQLQESVTHIAQQSSTDTQELATLTESFLRVADALELIAEEAMAGTLRHYYDELSQPTRLAENHHTHLTHLAEDLLKIEQYLSHTTSDKHSQTIERDTSQHALITECLAELHQIKEQVTNIRPLPLIGIKHSLSMITASATILSLTELTALLSSILIALEKYNTNSAIEAFPLEGFAEIIASIELYFDNLNQSPITDSDILVHTKSLLYKLKASDQKESAPNNTTESDETVISTPGPISSTHITLPDNTPESPSSLTPVQSYINKHGTLQNNNIDGFTLNPSQVISPSKTAMSNPKTSPNTGSNIERDRQQKAEHSHPENISTHKSQYANTSLSSEGNTLKKNITPQNTITSVQHYINKQAPLSSTEKNKVKHPIKRLKPTTVSLIGSEGNALKESLIPQSTVTSVQHYINKQASLSSTEKNKVKRPIKTLKPISVSLKRKTKTSNKNSPNEIEDKELRDIFKKEATQYISCIGLAINHTDSEVSAELLNAIHNLAGASSAARSEKMATLSGALNTQFEKHYHLHDKLEPSDISLMKEVISGLKLVLASQEETDISTYLEIIQQLQPVYDDVLPSEPEFQSESDSQALSLEKIVSKSSLIDGALTNNSDEDVSSELIIEDEDSYEDKEKIAPPDSNIVLQETIDPELLEAFIEEYAELMESSHVALKQWQQEVNNKTAPKQLQRDLHTLKGGARLVAITPIADLTHHSESLVIKETKEKTQPKPTFFALLLRCLDRLSEMQEQLAKAQSLTDIDDLMSAISSYQDAVIPQAIITTDTKNHVDPKTHPQVPKTDTHQKDIEPEVNQQSIEQIRIKADLLDFMSTFSGEANISRDRIGQQNRALARQLTEMHTTVDRLTEQLHKLELETETQILFRYDDEKSPNESDFDPLELDRFSQIQHLSRSLAESVNDLHDIADSMETFIDQSDNILLQQSRLDGELQQTLMSTRLLPFRHLAPRFERIVRQVSEELGKKAKLIITGLEQELDRGLLDKITAPIEHLIRNALIHGIEKPADRLQSTKGEVATLHLSLVRERREFIISLTDDGQGINLEKVKQRAVEKNLLDASSNPTHDTLIQFILHSGFSTADKVSQLAGRGVGLDVVNTGIKALKGRLSIHSTPAVGTRFDIYLPLTLSILQGLLVTCAEEQYAIPLTSVHIGERIRVDTVTALLAQNEQAKYEYGDETYQFFSLAKLLNHHTQLPNDVSKKLPLLLFKSGTLRIALLVDSIGGSREIVLKPIGKQLSHINAINGATILGDGRVLFVLDVPALVEDQRRLRNDTLSQTLVSEYALQPKQPIAFVVDDSITMRKASENLLKRYGFDVATARDGIDAVALLNETTPDIILLDIEMPRMDGYEFSSFIRNSAEFQHIPIVIITSRTGDKHRQRA
ncbi:MAG TPA: hypothetical protein DCS49_06035, partial [Gammaproteobacteria bacterium]|nr:hypothetical protein [Gammaproteobacteria bacterium]